jgi:endonuclease III
MTRATSSGSALADAVAVLERTQGAPEGPPTTDPFELVLYENVAYLASPAKRREAFEELRREVGTTPAALLRARPGVIERVAAGILKGSAAEKLRECARIAVEELGGDVAAALDRDPAGARRALRKFPGIGEPGADKILLLSGRVPTLAPESNALRVLARLGVIREEKSYTRTYAAGIEAAARALPLKIPALRRAHLLLQRHGQTLCRRTAPLCDACPLARGCAYAKASRARA